MLPIQDADSRATPSARETADRIITELEVECRRLKSKLPSFYAFSLDVKCQMASPIYRRR